MSRTGATQPVSVLRRIAERTIRPLATRVGRAALAVGLATATLGMPSAALAAPMAPIRPGPVEPGPVAPTDSRPDLVPFLFQSNTDVQPGQAVTYAVTTRNKGTANAGNSRTLLGLPREFSNVNVVFSPGSTCTVQYNNAGWLPGYWVLCNGGPLGVGQDRVIRVDAIAPTSPGTYGIVAEADANGSVAESNEGNNTVHGALTVL